MTVMDAVKKGFSVSQKSMGLLSILFSFNIIWNILGVFMLPQTPAGAPGGPAPASPLWVALSIIFILLSIFIQGGVLGVVKDLVKQGTAKLGDFSTYGKKYYFKLFGLGVLVTLIISLFAILAALMIAIAAPSGNKILLGIMSIAALIIAGVGIYFIILLLFSPYVLVVDDLGVVPSIKKSMEVVRKIILKVLGLAVILILIAFGLGLITGMVSGLVSLVIKNKLAQVIGAVLTSALNAYVSIIMTSGFMAFYMGLTKPESSKTA